ncbi:MAG: hypothetical protein ACJ76B_10990 [Solirubrobacterales bacterium]
MPAKSNERVRMIRNLKILGLALVALLAMSALASTASAQFESEAESTNLTASSNAMQKIAFSEGGIAIECTTLKVSGTQAGKANATVTIAPVYSNCETFLGAATSFNTNGCKFVFHLLKGSTSGTTDIECEAGKAMEFIIGSICRYTIGTQTGLGSLSFKNTGSGTTREIIVEQNLKGITSTRTTNDFFCPAGGSTGNLTGNWSMTGENAAGTSHTGIFLD